MSLNDEEIQKVYNVFSDMEVKCEGFPFTDEEKYGGFLDIVYINEKTIVITVDFIVLGMLKYQVSGNPDYVEQLQQLKREFAAARGIPLKN